MARIMCGVKPWNIGRRSRFRAFGRVASWKIVRVNLGAAFLPATSYTRLWGVIIKAQLVSNSDDTEGACSVTLPKRT